MAPWFHEPLRNQVLYCLPLLPGSHATGAGLCYESAVRICGLKKSMGACARLRARLGARTLSERRTTRTFRRSR